MPELIERKNALKNICKYCSEPKCKETECMVFAGIKDTPTSEPEVRHGRWISTEYDSYSDGSPVWDKWECSECGHGHSGEEDTLTAFCPDCGTRMDTDHIADASRKVGGVDNDKLKLCPFCGGRAELRQEDFDPRWMPTRTDPDSGGCPPYYVKCDDCGAATEYRYAYPDAAELWNRRTEYD